MKIPLQELLKLESDLTRMFDSDQRVGLALLEHIRTNRKEMLEKEKEVMCEFANDYADQVLGGMLKRSEQYYEETFN